MQSGWSFRVGPTLGVVAVVLLAAVAVTRVLLPRIELAVATAVLTATLAMEIESYPVGRGFAFGAYAGFVAGALALVVGFSEVQIRRVRLRRLLIGLVPIVAALWCAAIIVVPAWGIMPDSILEVNALARLDWLNLVFAVLGIWLAGSWARRLPDPTRGRALVLIPTGMLAIQTLELIETRNAIGISLARWILLPGLPVLLLGLGLIEEHGGLERLRIPHEIWRVDRISPGED
jgi:hypothetical protein